MDSWWPTLWQKLYVKNVEENKSQTFPSRHILFPINSLKLLCVFIYLKLVAGRVWRCCLIIISVLHKYVLVPALARIFVTLKHKQKHHFTSKIALHNIRESLPFYFSHFKLHWMVEVERDYPILPPYNLNFTFLNPANSRCPNLSKLNMKGSEGREVIICWLQWKGRQEMNQGFYIA